MHLMHERPIITISTDFGLSDYYVAAVKGALLRHCPQATLIDVTHQIAPQDVVAGSIVLERCIQSFDAGAVHLVVVDPGVGTSRRILIARFRRQWMVCPDNGLVSWAAHRCGTGSYYELVWRPQHFTNVFHARDIMAPAAGMLAAGVPIDQVARPIEDPILLTDLRSSDSALGKVIHIDHFGNCTTNIPAANLDPSQKYEVWVKKHWSVGVVRRTYGDVQRLEVLALVGSSDLIEVAVRDGSAAQKLQLRVGDTVECRPCA